jgi:hypothetical protein
MRGSDACKQSLLAPTLRVHDFVQDSIWLEARAALAYVLSQGVQDPGVYAASSHSAGCCATCVLRCAALCHVLHVQECIEAPLLSALDAESEASIATQIRFTLTALLAASAPTRPGYWVRLLAAVALAAGPAALAVTQSPAAGAHGATVSLQSCDRVLVCNGLNLLDTYTP